MRRSRSEPFRDFARTSGLAGYSFGLLSTLCGATSEAVARSREISFTLRRDPCRWWVAVSAGCMGVATGRPGVSVWERLLGRRRACGRSVRNVNGDLRIHGVVDDAQARPHEIVSDRGDDG
jgi:hypothetical protein